MGQRGPAKKPTNLKVLEGNPGKRKLNGDEPQYEPCDATPPEELTGRSKEIWDREALRLINAGVMTQADRLLFAAYCRRYADWEHYRAMIAKHGELFKAPSGYVQQSPYVGMANKALEQAIRIAREFGITPASRTGVKASGRQTPSRFFTPSG